MLVRRCCGAMSTAHLGIDAMHANCRKVAPSVETLKTSGVFLL